MRPVPLLIAVSIAVVPMFTACSGGDESDSDAVSTTPGDTTVTTVTTLDSGTSPETANATDADQQSDTTPAPPTVPTTEPAASFFGSFATVIVQHTAETGDGIRPLLEWDAVLDADHYGVYLYAPSGATYWAWRGTETSVFVGGATQIREDAAGPSIADGMSWAVIAFDADLLPLAASPLRPIAP